MKCGLCPVGRPFISEYWAAVFAGHNKLVA